MNKDIDGRIRVKLVALEQAYQKEKQYHAREVVFGQPIQVRNFYEWGAASDIVNQLEIQLDLLLAEKYPEKFSKKEIAWLEEEASILKSRIHSWCTGHIPIHRSKR